MQGEGNWIHAAFFVSPLKSRRDRELAGGALVDTALDTRAISGTACDRMSYIGGKGQAGVLQRIINLIPPHTIFIEGFAGSAAVTRAKQPARETFVIDLAAAPEMARLPAGARFIQGDAISFLANYKFTGKEFVYLDPPYLLGTRGRRCYYQHEMTAPQHARLLAILAELPARVLISGYPSAMYDEALADWTREEFQVMTRGHTWATEVLWFNYPRPTALHDYGKLGHNHNDRTRIRRKIERWTARLARQDPLERSALFSALVDAMGITAARLAIEACAARIDTGQGAAENGSSRSSATNGTPRGTPARGKMLLQG